MVAAQLGACDVQPVVDGEVAPRAQLGNGAQLNSAHLNGFTLNGFTLNGLALNGFTLNGFTLNGFTLNGFTLNGTSFSATALINGIPTAVAGADLVGTQIRLMHSGKLYVLHLDAIYPDPSNPGGDVLFYDISVHDVFAGTVSPLCEVGGVPAAAIPLANLWDPITGDRIDDPEVITFACRGAVLAKCVEWGYRPWATATRCNSEGVDCQEVSLADHHQACTRMARADYCGDGVPHTYTGTLIDVYDRLSPAIQAQATAEHPEWGAEAEWGPDGATCIGASRRLQLLEDQGTQYTIPECFAGIDAFEDCGEFPDARPDSLVGNSYCEKFGTDPVACE